MRHTMLGSITGVRPSRDWREYTATAEREEQDIRSVAGARVRLMHTTTRTAAMLAAVPVIAQRLAMVVLLLLTVAVTTTVAQQETRCAGSPVPQGWLVVARGYNPSCGGEIGINSETAMKIG